MTFLTQERALHCVNVPVIALDVPDMVVVELGIVRVACHDPILIVCSEGIVSQHGRAVKKKRSAPGLWQVHAPQGALEHT